ncbi:MAG: fasciclin domain-containing protein [Planctomycetia bacterium]|nr:fasciclin domain-containing protein [Planctomycetia bacterium]
MNTTEKHNCSAGRWTLLAVVLVFALAVIAWATMEQKKNILKTAEEIGECKTFVECVQKAGLSGVLEKDGPFSVFIPTDTAFAKLSSEQLTNLLNNKSALTALLLYHMVPKRLTPEEMENLESCMTCTVPQTSIACTSKSFGTGNCIKAALPCTNGVIFLIDSVQVPSALNNPPAVLETEEISITETSGSSPAAGSGSNDSKNSENQSSGKNAEKPAPSPKGSESKAVESKAAGTKSADSPSMDSQGNKKTGSSDKASPAKSEKPSK